MHNPTLVFSPLRNALPPKVALLICYCVSKPQTALLTWP
jgi:hypothetical protein